MMEERHVKLIQEWPWDCRPALRWLFEHYEKTKQSIMKQFNLEKALAGEKVITRDGCEVKIAGYFDKLKYGILGWVHRENEWFARSWTKDGQFDTLASVSTNDLFMAPTTKTVWFALYRNPNNSQVFTTHPFCAKSALESFCYYSKVLKIYSETIEEE